MQAELAPQLCTMLLPKSTQEVMPAAEPCCSATSTDSPVALGLIARPVFRFDLELARDLGLEGVASEPDARVGNTRETWPMVGSIKPH